MGLSFKSVSKALGQAQGTFSSGGLDKVFGGMFGGRGAGDGGAGEARRLEEERQAKIQAGTNRVNDLFGGAGSSTGQFNDDYFSKIGQSYRDYYLPQVDQQYQDAVRAIKVGSPSLQSSSFARREGKLAQDYERSKGDVADRSLSAEGGARSDVENSRNSILAAVRAGAGAEDAAASATNSIKALKAPPVYSPIGDLFARYLNTSANATVADNLGYQRTPLSLNTLFPRSSSALRTVA